MNILLINTVNTDKNGITNVMLNLLNAIDITNLHFDWIAINNPNQYYKEAIENRGGKIFVIERSYKNIIRYYLSLIQLIKKNNYDAIHIHGNSHLVTLELSAAFIAGCKIRIVHSHTTTCKHPIIHKILTPIFNLLYTHSLACGHDAGIWMYGNRPYLIINNGIDTKKFLFDHVVREQLQNRFSLTGKKILGNVGSLTHAKNQKFLIEVFAHLYSIDNDYRLLILGDGILRASLEQLVTKYKLHHAVTFLGSIDTVNEYLNAIDIIVMPSLYEGLPLTLIEAQDNGLYCIIADTITSEVDKSGNVKFLPLSAGAEEWARIISATSINTVDQRIIQSITSKDRIEREGYNIFQEATKLKKYYLDSIKYK